MVWSAVLAMCLIIQPWTAVHCAAPTLHIYEQYLVWSTFYSQALFFCGPFRLCCTVNYNAV